MPTINQLVNNNRFSKKVGLKKTPALYSNPQKLGTCLSVFIKTPRKPNSALRKVAKVRLVNSRIITVYIPGEGHNISRFSDVLISGRRVRDLPGVKYGALRGKFDLSCIEMKKNSRSKYGTKKEKKIIFKIEKLKRKKTKFKEKKYIYYKIFCRVYLLFINGRCSLTLIKWWINSFYIFRINFFKYCNNQLQQKSGLEDENSRYILYYLYHDSIKKLYKRRYKVLSVTRRLLYVKDTIAKKIYSYNMRV